MKLLIPLFTFLFLNLPTTFGDQSRTELKRLLDVESIKLNFADKEDPNKCNLEILNKNKKSKIYKMVPCLKVHFNSDNIQDYYAVTKNDSINSRCEALIQISSKKSKQKVFKFLFSGTTSCIGQLAYGHEYQEGESKTTKKCGDKNKEYFKVIGEGDVPNRLYYLDFKKEEVKMLQCEIHSCNE